MRNLLDGSPVIVVRERKGCPLLHPDTLYKMQIRIRP
jgi:hypothetical protein